MIRQGPFQQAESADGHSEAHGFRHSAGCDIGDENTGNNEEFIGNVSSETEATTSILHTGFVWNNVTHVPVGNGELLLLGREA